MTPDDNLLDISDPQAFIYRIFPKHRFLNLLRDQKNGLVKPRLWDDPFENFFLRSEAVDPDGTRVSLDSLAEGWFGQCWTLNNDTDAMWRIYSPAPANDSIKVRTTIRKLFGSFYDTRDKLASLKFLMGKVQYLTEANITALVASTSFGDLALGGQATGFARLLCVKREAFAHEGEVRLLFQDVDGTHRADVAVQFDFDVNSICDEVVLDPRLPAKCVDTLTADIQAAGCTLPITQSTLYRVPKFTVNLG